MYCNDSLLTAHPRCPSVPPLLLHHAIGCEAGTLGTGGTLGAQQRIPYNRCGMGAWAVSHLSPLQTRLLREGTQRARCRELRQTLTRSIRRGPMTREEKIAVVERYIYGLGNGDFSQVPFADDVSYESPL